MSPTSARLTWPSLLAAAALALAPVRAAAVRPFITDDARVSDPGTLLLETSARMDRATLQNLNVVTAGLLDGVEIGAAFSHGAFSAEEDGGGSRSYGLAGPILQVKGLLARGAPNRLPALAAVVGVSSPLGTPGFAPSAWGGFGYLAVTESLFDEERLLLHANLGTFAKAASDAPGTMLSLTWGVGAQLRLVGGLHALGEVVSGDPYADRAGGAFQAGFRYVVSEAVQIDATVGEGLWGETRIAPWAGLGLRLVSGKLF